MALGRSVCWLSCCFRAMAKLCTVATAWKGRRLRRDADPGRKGHRGGPAGRPTVGPAEGQAEHQRPHIPLPRNASDRPCRTVGAHLRGCPPQPWSRLRLDHWTGPGGVRCHGDLLRTMEARPGVSAALYRAAARIPGVVLVSEATDSVGRAAVARVHNGERTEANFRSSRGQGSRSTRWGCIRALGPIAPCYAVAMTRVTAIAVVESGAAVLSIRHPLDLQRNAGIPLARIHPEGQLLRMTSRDSEGKVRAVGLGITG